MTAGPSPPPPRGLLALLTALVAVRFSPLVRLDVDVSDAARRFTLAHPAWRATMSAVTHSGDSAVVRGLTLLALLVLLVRRDRTAAGFLVATAATSTVVRLALLGLVHRPRPADRLTTASGYSYPSGHTTSSAVAAGVVIVLGWALLPNRWSRAALVAVAGGWAVLVGVSRVALAAHWPTDVIGGWLLAATVTIIAASVLRLPRRPDAAVPGERRLAD
ncbi:phosphatase PAP2 family protein [Dactylosporangium sp. McL0621]|uniref:phosphatase PAP2 family protein n=1 Tax=Dactylosporangium sp. McL0621 TaxID=3415678 RepID=UPI003CF1696F